MSIIKIRMNDGNWFVKGFSKYDGSVVLTVSEDQAERYGPNGAESAKRHAEYSLQTDIGYRPENYNISIEK